MPAIGYPGGKARLAQKIVSFLPREGRMYVEPFARHGNLFWAAASSGLKYESWWLNDIATIPFFQSIKGIGHDLRVPQLCRSEYELQKKAYCAGNLEAILLEPYLTFSGGGYHRGLKETVAEGYRRLGTRSRYARANGLFIKLNLGFRTWIGAT